MKENELYLNLSGLQHFAFCRRRWALIYMEQRWEDNVHTTQGQLMHANAHEGLRVEKRGGVMIVRHMHVCSHRLGLSGVCDVVEFREDADGVSLYGREGRWRPAPVEYKKGRPHAAHADSLQLCGQAMCLEEMLVCTIHEAYLYYGEPRRRTTVALDEALREEVRRSAQEMRTLYARRHTPCVKAKKACRACSLSSVCLPSVAGASASDYVARHIREDGDA